MRREGGLWPQARVAGAGPTQEFGAAGMGGDSGAMAMPRGPAAPTGEVGAGSARRMAQNGLALPIPGANKGMLPLGRTSAQSRRRTKQDATNNLAAGYMAQPINAMFPAPPVPAIPGGGGGGGGRGGFGGMRQQASPRARRLAGMGQGGAGGAMNPAMPAVPPVPRNPDADIYSKIGRPNAAAVTATARADESALPKVQGSLVMQPAPRRVVPRPMWTGSDAKDSATPNALVLDERDGHTFERDRKRRGIYA